MPWGLVDAKGDLPPLVYSNGKTQKDVVNEIIEKFDDNDMIFLKGGVGTGKSAIALHLIGYYGKGIISTPTKLLQRQYTGDYGRQGDKHVLLPGGRILSVNFLMGRSNFKCQYNSKRWWGYYNLPCTRRLGSDESRLRVASECPFWSPVYSSGYGENLRGREAIEYQSIVGAKKFYRAGEPCVYYDQFIHFTRLGAILMNSAKWEVETWLGRKPKVPIEIIDEGDEYLDSLTYRTVINERLFQGLLKDNSFRSDSISHVYNIFSELVKGFGENGYDDMLSNSEVILDFFEVFIDLLSKVEPNDYIKNVIGKMDFIFKYKENAWARTILSPAGIILFIPNPEITLNALAERSGKMLFMSATTHSLDSFNRVFKIKRPPIIVAEEKFPGLLYIMRPSAKGQLSNITYQKWNRSSEFREHYWELLDRIIEVSSKPCLVQVHARGYLPEKYRASPEQRREKYWGFGDKGVFFSTKTDRGIDLKNDLCRSIILMKYPMPNISEVVFKTMRNLLGDSAFWEYINDMANRNMVQQCGRAVRHEDDWCEVYTLDAKVLRQLPHFWRGDYVMKEYDLGGG